MDQPQNTELLGLSLQELTSLVETQGEASYRARQLFDGLYRQRWSSLEQFTTLSLGLRQKLRELGYTPGLPRIEKSFAPLRDLVAGVHLHDNHGDKDEHLPPYEGTIDWPAAIKILKTAPETDLPLVLELKEKTGPEAPGAVEQLEAARKAMDRFEAEWE